MKEKKVLTRLTKLEDPGTFTVPCSVLGVYFEDSLCYTGSTMNLMSFSVAKGLGIENFDEPPCTLKFTDASITKPQGFQLGVLVRVGHCLVPTDFQVVEIVGGSNMPLLLQKPFLNSVRAIMDMPKQRLTFHLVDKIID